MANYQELNRELEEIIQLLESPEVDIDEAMKSYERGMIVAKELETYLQSAENKITKIQTAWNKKQK